MVKNLNQNQHIYVANAYADSVTESSAVGTIGLKAFNDGVDKQLFFTYKGVDTVLKSDIISVKNLNYAKAIAAADMVTPFKSQLIALDEEVNEGKPIVGQDYVLRIVLRQFFGMSDEDQYFKDAAVHATSAMNSDPSKFYEAMVKSLNMCFSREINSTKDSNPYLSFTASAEGITITEKAQEHILGTMAQENVLFEAVPTTILCDGADVSWGTVTDQTPAKEDVVVGTNGYGNGTKIADLEYFLMGERGDQYRMQGWPNYINTKYLADSSKQYNVLDLHFAFTDTGINSYRSEKDITIVAENAAVINSIVGALNTATGLSIETI